MAEPAADQGGNSLAVLAAVLVNLSPSDRAKLAAMLIAGNDTKANDLTSDASPSPTKASKIGKGKAKAQGKAKRTTK